MIRLEDTTVQDLPKILAIEQDLDNNSFICPSETNRHQRMIQQEDTKHLKILDDQHKIIGFILLTDLHNPNDSIELKRIIISEKGKGYGSAAMALLLKICFTEYNCHRLWLDVFDTNPRARHVYRKLGFTEEGTLREAIKKEDGYKNLVVMSILKSEYLQS